MSTIETRQASVEDAEEIARLLPLLGYETLCSEIMRRLQEVLASDQHFVSVCPTSAEGLLGWIEMERRSSLIAGVQGEITGLIVDSKARRTGVGRALVAHAESWAEKQGVERITVRSDVLRQPAGKFYESLGYTECKKQSVRRKACNCRTSPR